MRGLIDPKGQYSGKSSVSVAGFKVRNQTATAEERGSFSHSVLPPCGQMRPLLHPLHSQDGTASLARRERSRLSPGQAQGRSGCTSAGAVGGVAPGIASGNLCLAAHRAGRSALLHVGCAGAPVAAACAPWRRVRGRSRGGSAGRGEENRFRPPVGSPRRLTGRTGSHTLISFSLPPPCSRS